MNSIMPIPTKYNGVQFRSRLEARWAVFFDALEIEWYYEYEGYQLESGWYVPDFYLPDIVWDGAFLEVKPTNPSKEVLKQFVEMADSLWDYQQDAPASSFYLAVGAPSLKNSIYSIYHSQGMFLERWDKISFFYGQEGWLLEANKLNEEEFDEFAKFTFYFREQRLVYDETDKTLGMDFIEHGEKVSCYFDLPPSAFEHEILKSAYKKAQKYRFW